MLKSWYRYLVLALSFAVNAYCWATPNELYKIVIVGNVNVGKSSIIEQISSKKCSLNHRATIGVEFCYIQRVLDDSSLQLILFDTGGAYRLRDIAQNVLRGTNGVILVYDITNPESFSELQNRFADIKQGLARYQQPAALMVLANKADLNSHRQVSAAEGRAFAESIHAFFFEVSAKDGSNLEEAIDTLARRCRLLNNREPLELDSDGDPRASQIDMRGSVCLQPCPPERKKILQKKSPCCS